MINRNDEFFSCRGKVYTVQDIYELFDKLGIKQNDVICVHSELIGFGRPLCGKEEYLETWIKILQDIVTENGLLIMPSFSYSFCKNEIYDVENTPSTVGVLPEYFRKMENVYRTAHPIFSFTIWGNRYKEYLQIGDDAFSLDSVYGKMIRDGGKILLLGALKGYTFYYLSEQAVGVSHRYYKDFNGTIKAKDDIYCTTVPYYVRKIEQKSILDESKLAEFLEEHGICSLSLAKSKCQVFDCSCVFELIKQKLLKDEGAFL